MARHLIVTEPFGDYAKGDRIEDAAAVAEAEKSNPAHVVAVNAPAAKKSAKKDEPAAD